MQVIFVVLYSRSSEFAYQLCYCGAAFALLVYLDSSFRNGYDGHHVLAKECRGVLSTSEERILVGNPVGVDLTRNFKNPLLSALFPASKSLPYGR